MACRRIDKFLVGVWGDVSVGIGRLVECLWEYEVAVELPRPSFVDTTETTSTRKYSSGGIFPTLCQTYDLVKRSGVTIQIS
jgi:hypothetical protein